MIDESDCKSLLGKYVAIGVDHWEIQNRLFFHFGILTEVSNGTVKINTKAGYRIIDISEIKEIQEGTHGQR